MDSLTQIVLGASTGELVAGKRLGNKALLWGAIGGTIPDLDVFLNILYDPIASAALHRGFSHSLIFALLFSPLFAYLIFRLYRRKYEYKTWLFLFFISVVTHPILDIFTSYGTQFLWPLDYRLTFNSVFVIDPLYTIPFLVCTIVVLFKRKNLSARRKWNNGGLIYSTSYLLLLLIIKLFVYKDVKDYYISKNISPKTTMLTPMPFTGFYWLAVAETNDTVHLITKSIFNDFDENEYQSFSKNNLMMPHVMVENEDYKDKLIYLSKNFYAIDTVNATINFYDLRFGTASSLTNNQVKNPIMGFGMIIENGNVSKINRLRSNDAFSKLNFKTYLDKIF